MLGESMQNALNNQLQAELYSAYIYLAMSAHCEDENFTGAAQWLKVQADEEVGHAMRFFNFVQERGGRVELKQIEKPPKEFKSLTDVFQKALEHERKITSRINELYEMAVSKEDYPTQVFLQWFVEEQVEEESSAEQIVDKLKMVGDDKMALLQVDRELGSRQSEQSDSE